MSLTNLKYGKKELSREEIKLNVKEDIDKLSGIYVFVIDGCYNCHKLVEQLNYQDVDYSTWTFVEVLGNINFFMKELLLDDMPTTRFYVNGEIKYEMFGIMFPNNIKMLMDKVSGFANG